MAAGLVLSALMRVDDTDPRIKFSAGWSSGGINAEFNATAHGTTVQGASVVFSFSGTHVEVYGTIYQLNGSEPAPISSYTLDDSSLATFVPTRQTDTQYQQLFYSSPVVDDGEHVLAITSTIEDSHFWLDYFAYYPSPSASSTPIVETGGITSHDDTSTSSQSSPSQPGSNRNDALLGALIGALVALVLLLCAVAFVYHRTRRRQDLKATAFVVDPPRQGRGRHAEGPSFP
ncbi:hypothetical protein CPB85DRAFT_1431999 [Mucidula mucida]|nr:hypothetical protein CPB85DRAFT_1431999 [Mucidula mucida]